MSIGADTTAVAKPTGGGPQAASVGVSNLKVVLSGSDVAVVEEIAIDIRPGEIVGLVGESGSGKTTAGLALLGFSRGGLSIVEGSVRIADRNMLQLEPDDLLAARRS